MTEKPIRTASARTFVVRVVVDEHTGAHGQASEPGSADEWHVTAASLAGLWEQLEQRLAARLAPALTAKLAGPPGGDPARPEE